VKILLVRNDNIGDLICSTPAIEAFKKKYPQYQIDIVVNSYNYDAIYKNNYIDKIYCYTKSKHIKSIFGKVKALIHKFKIIIDIRKEKYDAVVVLRRGYSKSAELFSRITGAKYKIGTKNNNGKDYYNIYIEVKEGQHEVEFCYDALNFFNVENNNENTSFYIDEKNEGKYLKYKHYNCFHISARMENNKIGEDKLNEILEKIDKKKLILTSEPSDYELAEYLATKFDIEFVKTKSFIDLGALFKNLDFVISLEGGAMHLASAVGTKIVTLFGQSDINRWYPWGYKNLVIQDDSRIANNIDVNKLLILLKEKDLID
jgi:heptosyltransferase III